MAKTFKEMISKSNNLLLYIITPDSIEEIQQVFDNYGLNRKYVLHKRIQYEEISDHLSAADIGILFIPSYPSQQFRCPIKTANYLACGLPYLITENIGDDSKLAKELDVGLILDNENCLELSDIKRSKNFERKRLQKIVNKLRDINLVVEFLKRSLA